VLAREVTKIHEEFVRGRLSEIELAEGATRGEMVLMIGPPLDSEQPEPELTSILERTEQIARTAGLDQKAALKQAARERGISKSEAYRRMIAERNRRK
jgi:16S rRNA (cytidine1402-2'-O)-methyltransferase